MAELRHSQRTDIKSSNYEHVTSCSYISDAENVWYHQTAHLQTPYPNPNPALLVIAVGNTPAALHTQDSSVLRMHQVSRLLRTLARRVPHQSALVGSPEEEAPP